VATGCWLGFAGQGFPAEISRVYQWEYIPKGNTHGLYIKLAVLAARTKILSLVRFFPYIFAYFA
jgi:hypothetical protein